MTVGSWTICSGTCFLISFLALTDSISKSTLTDSISKSLCSVKIHKIKIIYFIDNFLTGCSSWHCIKCLPIFIKAEHVTGMQLVWDILFISRTLHLKSFFYFAKKKVISHNFSFATLVTSLSSSFISLSSANIQIP